MVEGKGLRVLSRCFAPACLPTVRLPCREFRHTPPHPAQGRSLGWVKVPSKAAQASAGFEQAVCASILQPVLGDGLVRQEGLTKAVHGHTASALEFSR